GGNAANYNWSVSGQPSWLAIDAATGELSGTPPAGSAGTYTFSVEVTDGQETASKQFDLVVQSGGGSSTALKADFEANPTNGKASLTVTFTDKSTGNPTSWEWDFDNDGTVDSTQQNPTHTYSNAGWYTVRLTVSDGADSDTCVKEMYVLVANNIWYVNGNGGDDGNGGTGWSDAWRTLGNALTQAGDYDLVLVADATYNETDLKFNGKKIYLKGVDHNSAGAQPVIDCQGKGRAFYFGSGETKDSIVDNFTIQNGKKDGTSYPDNLGGAILCKNNSSPTITSCTFSGNSAYLDGGGICCTSSSPTITNCTFSNNSGGCGGAVYCHADSSPNITNCIFSNNSGGCGGAVYCHADSSPNITNCVFSNNSVTQSNSCGGAIYCDSSSPTLTDCTFSGNSANDLGGAIFCVDSSSPKIMNCTFSGNSATGARSEGGAIFCMDSSSPKIMNCSFSGNSATGTYSEGGAIFCEGYSSASIIGCTFSGNTAGGSGGAIYCDISSPTITDCTFSGNSTSDAGGVIYCDSSSLTVSDCTFSGNSANLGGVIYCDSSSPSIINCIFSGNTANWDGGAIFCASSSPTITNCTFSGNSASGCGGAIECYSSGSTLNNCILWGDSAGSDGDEICIMDSSSSCTLNYCCVDNTGYGGITSNITENNCIHQDPQFANAAGGDYHLKDTSPCMDAGDNSLVPSNVDRDLDGDQRIVDGDNDGTPVVDIGAYEYQP
ncbi:MAG: hypothetical protein DRP63_06140, partial [Planctomycetota bacterium]